jgi:hypothetical protein
MRRLHLSIGDSVLGELDSPDSVYMVVSREGRRFVCVLNKARKC